MLSNDKILFLDVDGVLNSRQYVENNTNINAVGYGTVGMDPLAIDLLFNIVKETDCKIVVSSTWRHHGINVGSKFHNELSKTDNGKIILKSVIDITPDKYKHKKLKHKDCVRGDEIKLWLELNNFDGTFVIVDDDSDMDPLKSNFVKTTFEYGLTEKNADEIIKRLNNKI